VIDAVESDPEPVHFDCVVEFLSRRATQRKNKFSSWDFQNENKNGSRFGGWHTRGNEVKFFKRDAANPKTQLGIPSSRAAVEQRVARARET
jgi:hypothetical protein